MKKYLVKAVLKNGKFFETTNENHPGSLSSLKSSPEKEFVVFIPNKYRKTETSIRIDEIVLWQVQEVCEESIRD